MLQVDVAWIGLLEAHLADLHDHGAGSVIGEHFAPQVENDTVEGALVAMPWFSDAGLPYYRSDLLEAYGYEAPPETWSELETMAAAIQDGHAAFMRNWPYAYALGQEEGSPIAGLSGVAPLPAAKDGTSAGVLGGWNLAVSAYSDAPAVAADLALFLASADEQKIRAIEGAYAPTVEALYDDPEAMAANPFFEPLADVFAGATPRPTTVTGSDYDEVSSAFHTAVHDDVLTGAQEAGPALEALSLELQEISGFPAGQP